MEIPRKMLAKATPRSRAGKKLPMTIAVSQSVRQADYLFYREIQK
jgi:hypothetical protein